MYYAKSAIGFRKFNAFIMKKIFAKYQTTSRILRLESQEDFKIGEKILIDTGQGIEVAVVCRAKEKEVEKCEDKILRQMTDEDRGKLKALREKDQKAFSFCKQRIGLLRLPMKLVQAQHSLDEKKLTFYFIAEERIDFRELLSQLISNFHKNIRLQQLGARDAAKMIKGIGPCGRTLCCQNFLENIDSVTLEMAKEQDLAAVGSNKISGSCGKLMCCLSFEVDVYEKMRQKMPKINDKIETKKGKGTVLAQNILKQTVLVLLEDGSKIEEEIYTK